MAKQQAHPTLIDSFMMRLIAQEFIALGAIAALVETGTLSPYLKKSAAHRQFGRYRVEQWIAKGHLTIRKDGNQSAAYRIGRVEVAMLALISKLAPLFD